MDPISDTSPEYSCSYSPKFIAVQSSAVSADNPTRDMSDRLHSSSPRAPRLSLNANTSGGTETTQALMRSSGRQPNAYVQVNWVSPSRKC